jgi:undecaprenyl-diphosphatase
MFGLTEPQIFFDVLLHVGTLLAVTVYLRADIWKIVKGLREAIIDRGLDPSTRLFLWIIVATIPTGLMGLFLKGWFESLFSRPKIVGGMLLITGSFLWFTRRTKEDGRRAEKMTWIDSILIGVAQGVAIIPGISRSGATISAGLFRGLDRELSGKFSFLLSIPAILGATVLECRKMGTQGELGLSLIGMAVAFGVGLLSLRFLMKMIRSGKLHHFSYYCWAMGVMMILLVK